MAWTEFYMTESGNNLNSGSSSDDVATLTYASGNWVVGLGVAVFTVASGNPSSDGIVVGDWVSVYPDGNTVTPFIGKVTARDSTTITVDLLTNKFGTHPTDGTGNRTLKRGGAWFNLALCGTGGALNGATAPQATKINLKDGYFEEYIDDRTFGPVGTVDYPVWWSGYLTTPGDLDNIENYAASKPIIYQTRTLTLSERTIFSNIIFYFNKATTPAVITAALCVLHDCDFSNDSSGALVGHSSTSKAWFIGCNFYSYNEATLSISNTPPDFLGCCFYNGSNGIETNGGLFYRCIFNNPVSCGILTATGALTVLHCSFYSTGSDAIKWTGTPGESLIANNVFHSSGGYDINNASGATSNNVAMFGNVSYSPTSGHTNGLGAELPFPQLVDSASSFIDPDLDIFWLAETSKAIDAAIPYNPYGPASHASDAGAAQRAPAGGRGSAPLSGGFV